MLVETVVKPVFTLATLDSAFNVKVFFIFMLQIKMSEKCTQKRQIKAPEHSLHFQTRNMIEVYTIEEVWKQ